MSKVIKLKKGLDIKLNGEAEKVVQPAGKITSCAVKTDGFPGYDSETSSQGRR